jgi:SPP1 gp7 family putative phage head morphogenesis protein
MATEIQQVGQINRLLTGKSRKKKKVPKWKYPHFQEVQYERYCRSIVARLRSRFHELVSPQLETLSKQAQLELTGKADSVRVDDWADTMKALMTQLRAGFESESRSSRAAEFSFDGVAAWNNKEWRNILRSTFGVDVLTANPDLRSLSKSFVSENVALIKSIQEESLTKVEGVINTGFKNGITVDRISQQIEDKFDTSSSRARLIARDQIGKLNGSISRSRQTTAGLTKYIWRTAGDERVRESHEENEGQEFSWDDPPEDTGNPGEDIQCRCYAEPSFDDILGEGDEE